jgi:hypothetical protein
LEHEAAVLRVFRIALAVALALAFACAVGACSASTDERTPRSSDPAETAAEVCDDSYASRWFVSLDHRPCTDVEGDGGSWVAAPLESDPSDAVCTMTWRGGEGAAAADVTALRAFIGSAALAPACDGPTPAAGALVPIPFTDDPEVRGSNGCEVCGKLFSVDRLTIILPPDAQREVIVELVDGSRRAFRIETKSTTRAVAVVLPPAPAGLAYVSGRATVR